MLPFSKDETPEADEMVRFSGPSGDTEFTITGVSDCMTRDGTTEVGPEGELCPIGPSDSVNEAVALVAPPSRPATPTIIGAPRPWVPEEDSDMMASR